jgi:hypothetical protein
MREEVAAFGHQQVRLDDLRRGGPERDLGGLLHVTREFERLAVEHDDVMTGSRQQKGREEASGAASDDGDLHLTFQGVLGA